jgi:hypothetical protein
MTLHNKLIHAVTEFDRKQSKKPHYNLYALAQYIGRVQEVTADIAEGANPREAITAAFSGRLLAVCLKAASLDKATTEEIRGTGTLYYVPVSKPKTLHCANSECGVPVTKTAERRKGLCVSCSITAERRVHCDSCAMVSINGIACHETGCPNKGGRYDYERDAWVQQRKCFECGSLVDIGEPCC